ncbi:ABC transporter related [Beutenbergia cavernae DSM 12333]|uniref:ABC transporter related n=1 Tax=Beutenbergia cavernae (strain ATCC BAA-8 / DSM 12333 / CCUG 43141 / JCM 11478 / NBRC 16432 / NCIMB 13614 / HKI 0122) TaxID=471853 RepID=C5C4Q2_BEUC1|nr:metal ABC transporter ATP-binding protein [Beutenbergia cavernae]ACQ80030.1 ABC transporter related [Beutenbergia cavernae DSM 12333]
MPDVPADVGCAADDELTPAVLETRALDVAIGGSRILADVDLRVDAGEFVALLGANGSGKSTLVRTLVGIQSPSAGRALLFGVDVTQRSRVPWTRLGYVPQRSTAASGVPATALEVVVAGLLAHGRLRPPRGARARAREALDRVGLADRAHRSVGEMSGGQQQRVLIARALARRPELLVLDEPLAGVDRPSQDAFTTTMAQLRDEGTTVLVVLHEIEAFVPFISRAVVLRHGRVVHDGAPPRPAPGHRGVGHEHTHAHATEAAAAAVPGALHVEPWSTT